MDKVDYSRPENILRPLKAIREKCKDCQGGAVKEIPLCQITGCSLWPYRLGRRPEARAGSAPELPLEGEKVPPRSLSEKKFLRLDNDS